MINQLFNKTIPKDLLEKILNCFNLKNLDEKNWATQLVDLYLDKTTENVDEDTFFDGLFI